MKANSKTAIFIIFAVPIAFSIIVMKSFFLEYEPSNTTIYLLQYGLFIFFVSTYCYFVHIKKYPEYNGKTAWRNLQKTKSILQDIKQLTISFIFLGGLAYCMERWMAYPTKWFANEYVVKEMQCVNKSKLGYRFRNRVTIKTISHDGRERMEFPWPTDKAPACTGDVKIIGYKWFWGTYIVSVEDKKTER